MAEMMKKLEVVYVDPNKLKAKKCPEQRSDPASERASLDSAAALSLAWGLKAS
jgi:hypothetical protein